MRNPYPNPETIAELSVPELAQIILVDLSSIWEASSGRRSFSSGPFHNDGSIDPRTLTTHVGNGSMSEGQLTYMHDGGPIDVQRKAASAISWLETQGYLAPDFSEARGHFKRLTPLGIEAAAAAPDLPLPNISRLSREKLHSKLRSGAWHDFVRGEYSGAVFKAFQQVEIELRDRSGLKSHGVALATSAFSPERGPLANAESEKSEQQAMMMLFAGAFGIFRNGAGHNIVEYDDPERAARELQLADLLLRILDEQNR